MPIRDPELEIKRPAKHVEACVESIQDRGSTPLASTSLISVMEGFTERFGNFLPYFLPKLVIMEEEGALVDL